MTEINELMTEAMAEFLLTLRDFGGDALTSTLTGKGYTQDQLRYRREKLEPEDLISVELEREGNPREEENRWALTEKGSYVLEKWLDSNGRPSPSDDSKPAELTRGEVRALRERIEKLEDEVGISRNA